MSHPIQSEAHLTTFEAISMIVGNSIGTGIIAVPYLATKNSMLDVVWMVLIAYCVNVILHLIIAELSYNNGGVQLVKSFEGELFHGKMKQIFSWSVFIVYGLAIMIGVSGNINGGAQIFVNWFGMPFVAAQVLYYVIAGVVVFIGMKAVGIAQKYAVIVLMGIVAVMTVGTFLHPLNSLQRAQFHWNNLLALYIRTVLCQGKIMTAAKNEHRFLCFHQFFNHCFGCGIRIFQCSTRHHITNISNLYIGMPVV